MTDMAASVSTNDLVIPVDCCEVSIVMVTCTMP